MSVIEVIEFLAVVVSALFGVLLAVRKEMDAAGVIAVALIVAFGGGTLRDLLLDRNPLFWIERPHYPLIVFGIGLAASVASHWVVKVERWLLIPDALGMGLFTVVGARYALDSHTSLFLASLFGVITGTFGGVLGDVVCNEVPSLFRPAPLNATCAFAGAWVFLFLHGMPLPPGVASASGTLFILLFRLLAVRFHWSLPPVAAKRGSPP